MVAQTEAGSAKGPACSGVSGTVYLLCFGAEGLHVTGERYARHYIGWTEGEVDARVNVHLAGQGSPLVRAAVDAGCTVELTRVWTDADRHFERKLKRRREAPRLCPACCTRAGREPRNP